MATEGANTNPYFFYDEQIRRFLLQFTRIFSNFQVEYGRNEEGTAHTLVRVPIRLVIQVVKYKILYKIIQQTL